MMKPNNLKNIISVTKQTINLENVSKHQELS